MKPVSEINLENLERLIKEAGTLEALADQGGWNSSVYLNQLRNRAIDRKSGSPRNMGRATARRLEKAMKKPGGWMDKDHGATTLGEEKPDDVRLAYSKAIYRLLTQVSDAKLGTAMVTIQESLAPFLGRGVPE